MLNPRKRGVVQLLNKFNQNRTINGGSYDINTNSAFMQQIRKNEDEMLKQILGGPGTIQTLRKRLAIIEQNTNLADMNGANVQKIVENYKEAIKVSDDADIEAFRQLIEYYVTDQLNAGIKASNLSLENVVLQIVKGTREAIADNRIPPIQIFDNKQDQKIAHPGRVTRIPSLSKISIEQALEKDIEKFDLGKIWHNLPQVTRAFVRKNPSLKKRRANIGVEIQLKPGNMVETYNISLDPKTKAPISHADKTDQDALYANFRRDFLLTFDPNNKVPKMGEILDYMYYDKDKGDILFGREYVRDNKDFFLVGKNWRNITGLLGEIQALCCLSILMGNNFHPDNNIYWAGGWHGKGKHGGAQYHADVILENLGIQVTNTMKAAMGKVNFNSGRLSDKLQEFSKAELISEQQADIFMDLSAAYFFNQEYRMGYRHMSRNGRQNTIKRNQAFRTKDGFEENALFHSTRLTLESDFQALRKELGKLAAYLMYIGTGNAMYNERSNILFFIRGEVYLASELLSKVSSQFIDNNATSKNPFNVDISLRHPEESKADIVALINGQPDTGSYKNTKKGIIEGSHKTGRRNALSPSNPRLQAFENTFIAQLMLKSSYDFS